MRPNGSRRRVLEALAKARALNLIEPHGRLEHHALAEAVLHQIRATWVALLRQVGHAHGLKPSAVNHLSDLTEQLSHRNLISLEAQKLQVLVNDSSSWWSQYQAHIDTVECPGEPNKKDEGELIPLGDQARVEQIESDRYEVWVNCLADLVDECQLHFDES